MKKPRCLFLVAVGLLLMLSGCSRDVRPDPSKPAMRFVSQIDVTYRNEKWAFRWIYTDQNKMEAVLLYLRTLTPLGQVAIDPQRVEREHYEIVLHYSDGGTMVYYQHADRYLSKGYTPFEQVDPKQARKLPLLLEQMPSDVL